MRIARRGFRGGDAEELAVEHIRRVDECGERGRDVSRFANPRGLHVPTRAGHARGAFAGGEITFAPDAADGVRDDRDAIRNVARMDARL